MQLQRSSMHTIRMLKIGFCKIVFENNHLNCCFINKRCANKTLEHGPRKLFSKSCGVAYGSQFRYKIVKYAKLLIELSGLPPIMDKSVEAI